ncbi:MAG: hypothetical protein D8M58_17680 [Calditrichaeota bacterium]|nr:MAG: hypothetical protein DWQ03_01595 [Calditrichota bacterium]MBL1207238.1 hypothetical protein [Calditrichota bacterium]NOG47071.1 hypothetical protein [Calditrichota bacterium]
MSKYFVNKNAQSTGEHEIHKEGCSYLPDVQNRINLGDFSGCKAAMKKAKDYYTNVDGCYYCSIECHTR